MKSIVIMLLCCWPVFGNTQSVIVTTYVTNTQPIFITDTNRVSVSNSVSKTTVEDLRREGVLSNIVQELIKSGEICRQVGHAWREGRPGEGVLDGSSIAIWYMDYHPGTFYRTCRICGTCQSQSLNDWK